MSYITANFYTAYSGLVPVDGDWARLAEQASLEVDAATMGRSLEFDSYDDLLKDAIMKATADALDAAARIDARYRMGGSDLGSSGIQSERVGEHSVTYVAGGGAVERDAQGSMSGGWQSERSQAIYKAIHRHLAWTGLLYRGI